MAPLLVAGRPRFFGKTPIETTIIKVLRYVSWSDKASCYIADLTAHGSNHRITPAEKRHFGCRRSHARRGGDRDMIHNRLNLVEQ